MKKYQKTLLAMAMPLLGIIPQAISSPTNTMTFTEPFEFNPRKYVCYRAPQPVVIDGDIDNKEWEASAWTDDFVDIRGVVDGILPPKYRSRAKMMWDDKYLYIAAEMEEPHIWGTFTERESVIYYDNDFEVFIDVDHDTHNYYEFEMNAKGTEWDLMLTRPYPRGGTFFNGWNIEGMKSAVKTYGTINDPSDTDVKWTVEIAMPIHSLIATVYRKRGVDPGEQWRINFSRVEWLKVKIEDGKYKKEPGRDGFGHEENWVWSPTGVVDMHRPEYWGFLQFSDKVVGTDIDLFKWNRNEDVKWALRRLLLRQDQFRSKFGRYAESLDELKAAQIQVEGLDFEPILYPAGDYYKITAPGFDGTWWSITSDSRIWQGK